MTDSLPKTLVVMALAAESDGVFEAAGVPVLYCGVGKVNAAIALTRELSRYAQAREPWPLVVNFGTAGSRVHAAGTMLACHEFIQRDMDVRGLGFALRVGAGISFETIAVAKARRWYLLLFWVFSGSFWIARGLFCYKPKPEAPTTYGVFCEFEYQV